MDALSCMPMLRVKSGRVKWAWTSMDASGFLPRKYCHSASVSLGALLPSTRWLIPNFGTSPLALVAVVCPRPGTCVKKLVKERGPCEW